MEKNSLARLLASVGLAAIFVFAARLSEIDPYVAMSFFAGGMASGLVEMLWVRR